jgi:AcrR family transcriptional regulator
VTTSEARRSDARRNHERVVQAAVEVFRELGLTATVPDVAARAGVGKATVYRNFPSRDDLVEAVLARQLQWFEARTQSALRDPDPAAGFHGLITDWFDRIVTDRLIHDVLRSRSRPGGDRQVEGILAAFDQMTARAQVAGAIRHDVRGEDVRTLTTGCAQRLVETGQQDEDSRRLFTQLILDALRP